MDLTYSLHQASVLLRMRRTLMCCLVRMEQAYLMRFLSIFIFNILTNMEDFIRKESVVEVEYLREDVLVYKDKLEYAFMVSKGKAIPLRTQGKVTSMCHLKPDQVVVAAECLYAFSASNGKFMKSVRCEPLQVSSNLNHYLLAVESAQVTLWRNWEKVKVLDAVHSRFLGGVLLEKEMVTQLADGNLCVWNLNSFEVVCKFEIKGFKSMKAFSGQRVIIENKTGLYQYSNGTMSTLVVGREVLSYSANYYVTPEQLWKYGNPTPLQLPSFKQPIGCSDSAERLAVLTTTGILIFPSEGVPPTSEKENVLLDTCTAQQIQIKTLAFQKPNKKSSQVNSTSRSSTGRSMTFRPYTQPKVKLLEKGKLKKFYQQYCKFPEQQRQLAWASLLSIPLDAEKFNTLSSYGVHEAYEQFKYDFEDARLKRRLVRTLSCLAYECPLFAEVSYLPEVCFPLAKAIKDDLILFEVARALLMNCQFFSDFPNPPVEILAHFEQCVEPTLLQHLKKLKFNSVRHAWKSMRCFFTDILNGDDWLKFMDYYVANPLTDALQRFMAQYLAYFRPSLLAMKNDDQLDIFFAKHNPVVVDKLLVGGLRKVQVDGEGFDYPIFAVQQECNIRKALRDQSDLSRQQEELLQLERRTQEMIEAEKRLATRQEILVEGDRDRKERLQEELLRKQQKSWEVKEAIRQKRLESIKQIEQLISKTLDHEEKLAGTYSGIESLNEHPPLTDDLEELEEHAYRRFQELGRFRKEQEHVRTRRQELEYRQKQKQLRECEREDEVKAWQEQQQMRVMKQEKVHELEQLQSQVDYEKLQQEQMLDQMYDELRELQFERQRKLREMYYQSDLKYKEMNEEERIRDEFEQQVFRMSQDQF